MAYTKDVRILLGIKVTTVSVSSPYLTFPHTSGTKTPSPAPLGFSRLQRVNNKMIKQAGNVSFTQKLWIKNTERIAAVCS